MLFVSATAAAAQPARDDGLQIIPATRIPTEVVAPASSNGEASAPTRSYADVYRSIPFSRAEYLANPSYRHDAAMEILFGKLRPTTIIRNATPPVATDYDYITPYRYEYGGRARTYNFFYPRPSVYRNY